MIRPGSARNATAGRTGRGRIAAAPPRDFSGPPGSLPLRTTLGSGRPLTFWRTGTLPPAVPMGGGNTTKSGINMKTNKKNVQWFSMNHIFLGVCFALFSVFLISTYRMEDASSYMLPRILCVFGLVMIVIMVVSSTLKTDRVKSTRSEAPASREGLAVGYSIAFAIGYFFLTNLLGFILATALAVVAFSFLMKYENRKIIVLLAALIPLILHLAFVTLLKSSLPEGVIERLIF